mmetsp:Transcript_8561/g.10642  ORF Transcript_8561/g.10642 Transcript_8561/m.10642 type:complete len:215 (+) Transcript_8561:690-1334(+)
MPKKKVSTKKSAKTTSKKKVTLKKKVTTKKRKRETNDVHDEPQQKKRKIDDTKKSKKKEQEIKGKLKIGDDAPEFSGILDEDGNEISLSDFDGKYVVIYFYPKDNTPGCTKEGCKFRDLKKDFDKLNCVILGVSADKQGSHKKFSDKFKFNFKLLCDVDRELIKKYGASKAGNRIQRSTVLIDDKGKVAFIWNPAKLAATHPEVVLEKLKELQD